MGCMPLIEKELAEAIVHYEAERARGVATVPIDYHLTLLHKWREAEQSARNAVERRAASRSPLAVEREVLEGTDEFNAHHRAVTEDLTDAPRR